MSTNTDELATMLSQVERIRSGANNSDSEEDNGENQEDKLDDVRNNLQIFYTWIKNNYSVDDLNKSFIENFSAEYRISLFENICNYFDDEDLITYEILFYWKYIVYNLIKVNKKYCDQLENIIFNLDDETTNMRLVKNKYIFKCFINENELCYFKENGTQYYIS